jgi:hypothetical protein
MTIALLIDIIVFVKVFLIFMCSLNVIKNVYNLSKVLYEKSGKFELKGNSQLLLAMSISYLLSIIVMGI